MVLTAGPEMPYFYSSQEKRLIRDTLTRRQRFQAWVNTMRIG